MPAPQRQHFSSLLHVKDHDHATYFRTAYAIRGPVGLRWQVGKIRKSDSDIPVVPVKLTPVSTVVRAEPIVASGLVSSAKEARLSFKVGGIINQMFVEEGQSVRKGQLLATLNLTEIDAQVNQAQLANEKAERDLNQ